MDFFGNCLGKSWKLDYHWLLAKMVFKPSRLAAAASVVVADIHQKILDLEPKSETSFVLEQQHW